MHKFTTLIKTITVMATTNKSKTGSGLKKNAPEKAGTVAEQVTPIDETKEQQKTPEAPAEQTEQEKAEAKQAKEYSEARYANVYKELHKITGEYPDPQLNVEQLEELLKTKKQQQNDREAQEKELKLKEELAKQAELEAKAIKKAQEKKATQQEDPNVIWVQDTNRNKKQMNRVTWDIVKKSQTEWKEVPKAPIEVQKLK